MDKVRAQATQVAQKAQDAGRAGQAKLDQSQGKRRADALMRDLGAAVYAERTGRADPDTAVEIATLVGALTAHEAEYGPVSTVATADDVASTTAPPTAAPEGDSKLD
jgi:hypothetical protein